MTRFAVSSDFHGQRLPSSYLDMVKECSALLICGDLFSIQQVSRQGSLVNQIKGLTSDGVRVIYTPGNHDIWLYQRYLRDHPEDGDDAFFGGMVCQRFLLGDTPEEAWTINGLKELCGLEVLVDTMTEVDGVKIYGSPWSPHFCDWAFMGDDKFLKSKFKKIPDGVDILLTHTPPKIDGLEIDVVHEGRFNRVFDKVVEHCGSSVLTKYIKERKPRFAFSGHIHTGSHELCKFEDTECANVSLLNEDYNLAYKPRIVEIEK